MTTVTLSPKFQVVIPKAIRDSAQLRAGMKLMMVPTLGGIELIPLRAMRELKGSLKGMNTSLKRESDRNL